MSLTLIQRARLTRMPEEYGVGIRRGYTVPTKKGTADMIHLGFIVRIYLKHWDQYKIKVMLHGTIRSDDF